MFKVMVKLFHTKQWCIHAWMVSEEEAHWVKQGLLARYEPDEIRVEPIQ